jgi:hypothetical protein
MSIRFLTLTSSVIPSSWCKSTEGLRNTEAITDESDKDINVEPNRCSADEDELAKFASDDILEDVYK